MSKLPKIRVKPRDAKDRKLAKKLERYMNSNHVRDILQRAYVNCILYGPDRSRWPN